MERPSCNYRGNIDDSEKLNIEFSIYNLSIRQAQDPEYIEGQFSIKSQFINFQKHKLISLKIMSLKIHCKLIIEN